MRNGEALALVNLAVKGDGTGPMAIDADAGLMAGRGDALQGHGDLCRRCRVRRK